MAATAQNAFEHRSSKPSSNYDLLEFAYDRARARDFGEDITLLDPDCRIDPFESFVAAGLRITFLRQLSQTPIEYPDLHKLIDSILSAIPTEAFQMNGSIFSAMEQRIISGHLRLDGPPQSTIPGKNRYSARK
jgi:hypothetical protein